LSLSAARMNIEKIITYTLTKSILSYDQHRLIGLYSQHSSKLV